MLSAHAGQSLGLVENWSQVDWNKVAYLEALGYTPWWLTPTPPSTDLSGGPSLCFSFYSCLPVVKYLFVDMIRRYS